MIFKTITTLLRSIDQRIALQNELTAELIKAVRESKNQPAVLGKVPEYTIGRKPNHPKFVYFATDTKTGTLYKAFRQHDLALQLGYKCSGGNFARRIETGEPFTKGGHTYILSKEAYTNPKIKL